MSDKFCTSYTVLDGKDDPPASTRKRWASVLNAATVSLFLLVVLLTPGSTTAHSYAFILTCAILAVSYGGYTHLLRRARGGFASPVAEALETVAIVHGVSVPAVEAKAVSGPPPDATLVFTVNGKEQRLVNPSPSLILADYVRLLPNPAIAAGYPTHASPWSASTL